MSNRLKHLVYCMALLCLIAPETYAQDEDAEPGMQKAIYLPLKPPFVVNYGSGNKLKYLKADLSVRVSNSDVANSIRHHLPYIRNNLVMLFASQNDEGLDSQEGKEMLRAEALQTIKDLVMQEDETEGIVDVYFNTLLIQK